MRLVRWKRMVAHPWLGRVEVNALDSFTAGKELPLDIKSNVSRHSDR
jgi:hypothetical protein